MSINLGQWFTTPTLLDLKFMYFYVIEVADSKSYLGLFSTGLLVWRYLHFTIWNIREFDQDVVVMYILV